MFNGYTFYYNVKKYELYNIILQKPFMNTLNYEEFTDFKVF